MTQQFYGKRYVLNPKDQETAEMALVSFGPYADFDAALAGVAQAMYDEAFWLFSRFSDSKDLMKRADALRLGAARMRMGIPKIDVAEFLRFTVYAV